MSEKVFLGYEDEPILDKHLLDVTYTTNKIGGTPNWPPLSALEFDSRCHVCKISRPLVLQCYAPLPESPFHRTLYIYGCINPGCWNNSESWSCFRSQYIDQQYNNKQNLTSNSNETAKVEQTSSLDPWCLGADEWGDENAVDSFGETSVFTSPSKSVHVPLGAGERMSDSEDDEPSEMELIETCVENLSLTKQDKASSGERKMMGATAELEGSSSEVLVDVSKLPENNLFTLLMQVPELPSDIKNGINLSVQFDPKFVAVDAEYLDHSNSDHVNKLLQQYQKENAEDLSKVNQPKGKSYKKGDEEEYEKAVPLHGNELFHNFLTRIQMNPTQILRYSYGGQPLPMSPIAPSVRSKKCSHCNGDIWFELQILPTIIPSLKIANSSSTHLEFGTVFVYTCRKSCWRNEDKILTEYIFVQSEPL